MRSCDPVLTGAKTVAWSMGLHGQLWADFAVERCALDVDSTPPIPGILFAKPAHAPYPPTGAPSMKKIVQLLSLLPACAGQFVYADDADRFIGSWKLQKIEAKAESGD